MGLIDRFTRDGVSKVVWAGLMLGAIAGLVFAMIHGDAVVARERAAAQARAVAYVDQVLDPRVDASSSPVTGSDATSLQAALERGRPRGRARGARSGLVLGRHAALLHGGGRPCRSNAGLNDQLLDRVASGDTVTRSNVSDTGGATDPERSLLRTYVPLGSSIVAEVDQRTPARWRSRGPSGGTTSCSRGGLLLLFLVITALALRAGRTDQRGRAVRRSSIPRRLLADR